MTASFAHTHARVLLSIGCNTIFALDFIRLHAEVITPLAFQEVALYLLLAEVCSVSLAMEAKKVNSRRSRCSLSVTRASSRLPVAADTRLRCPARVKCILGVT